VEGILQNQLSLTRTTRTGGGVAGSSTSSSPPRVDTMPDVLVLNTCSIRDHAEQKLYDTLGPHAAAKRNGRQIAVIVTGCVAQQEGERLLRRIPEIDAVLGV
jgi:tRNA-2-methylthio-N6-dimethylallyladenosine synthase